MYTSLIKSRLSNDDHDTCISLYVYFVQKITKIFELKTVSNVIIEGLIEINTILSFLQYNFPRKKSKMGPSRGFNRKRDESSFLIALLSPKNVSGSLGYIDKLVI